MTPAAVGERRVAGASAGYVQLGAEGHGRERMVLPDVRRFSSCDCTPGRGWGPSCRVTTCSWQRSNVNRRAGWLKESQDRFGLVYGLSVEFTAPETTSFTNDARLVRAAWVTNPVSQPVAKTINRAETAAISVFLGRIMIHSWLRGGYRMIGTAP